MILFHKGIIYCVMVDASLHNCYLAKKTPGKTDSHILHVPKRAEFPGYQFYSSCICEHFAPPVHMRGVLQPLQVQQSSSWEQPKGEPNIHLFNIYSTRLSNHENPLIYRHGS